MAFLEGDNLVVLYYLNASDIWSDKEIEVVFGGSSLIRGGIQ